METLASKSAGKQIERSKSGYKPSKIAQKMFADLFDYSGAIYELAESPFHFSADVVY